jgi:membrane-bound lytic murein transglycosylase B
LSARAQRCPRQRPPISSTLAVAAILSAGVGGVTMATSHPPRTVADVRAIGADAPLAPFGTNPQIESLDQGTRTKPVISVAHPARSPHHELAVPKVQTRHRRPRSRHAVTSDRAKTAPAAHRLPRHAGALPAASVAGWGFSDHASASAELIPDEARMAYRRAATNADKADPRCDLAWQPIAAIGYVESDNARKGGSANPRWNGVATPPIFGPVLNGRHGTTAVRDTDRGRLDGTAIWDRTVGPMRILPAVWAKYAATGNHDRVANPQDIDDAASTAARYLCATGHAINRAPRLIRALHSYTHSYRFVRDVLTVAAHYEHVRLEQIGINDLPGARRHPHPTGPTSIVEPGHTDSSLPYPGESGSSIGSTPAPLRPNN